MRSGEGLKNTLITPIHVTGLLLIRIKSFWAEGKPKELRTILGFYYLRGWVRLNNQHSSPCLSTKMLLKCYAKFNNWFFLKLLKGTKQYFKNFMCVAQRSISSRDTIHYFLHLNAAPDTDFTLKPSNLRCWSIPSLILCGNPEHYSRSGSVIDVSIWKLGSSHYTWRFKTTVYSHKDKMTWVFL